MSQFDEFLKEVEGLTEKRNQGPCCDGQTGQR